MHEKCCILNERVTLSSSSMTHTTIAIVSFSTLSLLSPLHSCAIEGPHFAFPFDFRPSLTFHRPPYDSSLQFMHACTETFLSFSISTQMYLLPSTSITAALLLQGTWVDRWEWMLPSLGEMQLTVKVRRETENTKKSLTRVSHIKRMKCMMHLHLYQLPTNVHTEKNRVRPMTLDELLPCNWKHPFVTFDFHLTNTFLLSHLLSLSLSL